MLDLPADEACIFHYTFGVFAPTKLELQLLGGYSDGG